MQIMFVSLNATLFRSQTDSRASQDPRRLLFCDHSLGEGDQEGGQPGGIYFSQVYVDGNLIG